MRSLPAKFMQHPVQVESYLGTTGRGEAYAAPVEVLVFRVGEPKLVTNSSGEEVISDATLYVQAQDAPTFALDSRVTDNGVSGTVISRKDFSEENFVSFSEVLIG